MSKTFTSWLQEGEELYNTSLQEYRELEAQIADLEAKLQEKKNEVNQIAQVIGKPPVDGNRRLTAQLVEESSPGSVPNSPSVIARALSGRVLHRAAH